MTDRGIVMTLSQDDALLMLRAIQVFQDRLGEALDPHGWTEGAPRARDLARRLQLVGRAVGEGADDAC